MTSSKMNLDQIKNYLMENTDLKYFEIYDIIESFNKIIDNSILVQENDESYQSGYNDGYSDGFDNGYDKRCEEDL